MNIVCSKENLKDAIAIVSRAISSRTTLPILGCILLVAEDESLKLMANDMELGIETYVQSTKVELSGIVALEAKMFSEIVRKLPAEEVSIEVDNKNVCKIKSGRSEFKLLGQAGEEFPALPIIEKQNYYNISTDMLKHMIKYTSFSVAQDETRPALMGELFEIKNRKLSLVAVDGFRVAVRSIDFDAKNQNDGNDEDNIEVVIPAKTLNEISKILPSESNIKIYFTDKHALFEIGHTTVVSRLLTGEFIKYEQAFSADSAIQVQVSRYELLSCLERAMLMSHTTKNNPVNLVLDGYVLVVTAQTEMGVFNEEILMLNECSKLDISFNPKYLIDILKAIEDDEITLRFSTQLSPCIVIGEDITEYKYLVLPLKLK